MNQTIIYTYNLDLLDDQYFCDPKSILFEQIKKYNNSDLSINSETFSTFKPTKHRVKDLLRNDFSELAEYSPTLFNLLDKINFEEMSALAPEASVITEKTLCSSKKEASELFHVVISRNKLTLLFSIITKIDMFGRAPKTFEALPEYHKVLRSEKWTDANIYVSIIKQILDARSRTLEIEDDHPYVYCPYDVCEYIDGARKFIVAHEISHITRKGYASSFSEELITEIFDPLVIHPMFGAKDMEEIKTLDEINYDQRAIDYILAPLYKDNITQDKVYEVANHLVGMRFYFNLLFLIEVISSPENSLHPASLWREMDSIRYLVEKHYKIISKHKEVAISQINFSENMRRVYEFISIGKDRKTRMGSMGEYGSYASNIEIQYASIYEWLFAPNWSSTMTIFEKYYGSMKKLIDLASAGIVPESKYVNRVRDFAHSEKARVMLYGMTQNLPPDEIVNLTQFVENLMSRSEQ